MREFLSQWMPPNYSVHGAQVDNLIFYTHWLMLILFLFWGAYFLYVLRRFSAKRNPKAQYHGMQSHWSSWSEGAILVVEIVLMVGFSIPAWSRWATKPAADTNPFEVRVIAEQFSWNVQYPGPDGKFGRRKIELVTSINPIGLDVSDPAAKDDVVASNQFHLEVNRPVLIHISSKDVIHSFKLPVMRTEQDAIPGEDIPIHFTPIRTNEGETWEIACAQLCGLGHYKMKGQLVVETRADLDKWLASQPKVTQE